MKKVIGLSGLLGLTALLLLLAVAIDGAGTGASNQAYAQGAGNWKNVTLLYITDAKGKIDPCG